MAAKTMEQAFKKYRKNDADMSLWKAFRGGWEAAMDIKEARPTAHNIARDEILHAVAQAEIDISNNNFILASRWFNVIRAKLSPVA